MYCVNRALLWDVVSRSRARFFTSSMLANQFFTCCAEIARLYIYKTILPLDINYRAVRIFVDHIRYDRIPQITGHDDGEVTVADNV